MLDAIRKVIELQSAGGSNKKKQILQEFKDDANFCKFLYYALDPTVTFKISEATLRQQPQYRPEITLSSTSIFEVCERLASLKALDAATVYQVQAFIQLVNDEVEREFYTKLLAKTLRLGVTAKTVNQVIPGLIHEWEIQQAYPIDKYPLRDNVWFSLTQKLNGVRATYYKGQLYARSGVPYEGLDHIIDTLNIDALDGMVFDGELTLKDKGALSDNEAFRAATGIINSDALYKTEICYTIFDVISERDFTERGESSVDYLARRNYLDSHLAVKVADSDCVSVLPVLYSGYDQSKIDELLDQMVREDKEGLMVNLNVPYKCKRHNGILKVKRFYTMDLPITRCEEGTGRLAGTLGALVLDFKGNEVKVGSGFTDEQRDSIWVHHRHDIIGTLCEVKYKEVSSDKKTGAESLQFPVFVGLRTDKTDVSYG